MLASLKTYYLLLVLNKRYTSTYNWINLCTYKIKSMRKILEKYEKNMRNKKLRKDDKIMTKNDKI